jgi:hypothetical protein
LKWKKERKDENHRQLEIYVNSLSDDISDGIYWRKFREKLNFFKDFNWKTQSGILKKLHPSNSNTESSLVIVNCILFYFNSYYSTNPNTIVVVAMKLKKKNKMINILKILYPANFNIFHNPNRF